MTQKKITNDQIISIASKLEFDLVGFSKASSLDEEIQHLEEWLRMGYHHRMSYMERNIEKRRDISKILPNAKSVISLGVNYYKPDEFSGNEDFGKVSRYAWGKDYHYIIWEKLKEFESQVLRYDPSLQCASFVDTGPVMDKAWAVRAGLGWQGKHTNVINRNLGSWFFIATVVTNLELEPSQIQNDLCGSCTACIDACPTKALSEYMLDANKCISNLTIENRGEIPEEFKGKFDNWIFGCDVCQDVCPWNIRFVQNSASEEFSNTENKELNLLEVNQMTKSAFKEKYIGSPIYRAALKGLKRNSKFLQGVCSESK